MSLSTTLLDGAGRQITWGFRGGLLGVFLTAFGPNHGRHVEGQEFTVGSARKTFVENEFSETARAVAV